MKARVVLIWGSIAFFLAVSTGSSRSGIRSRRVVSTARRLKSIIQAPVHPKSTILFLIDGCRADILYGMIEGGLLPNIKRELFDKGVMAENAVTCVPSVTYCGIQSILTGIFPGRANIVGNRWFDRSTLERRSYLRLKDFYRLEDDMDAITIYEALVPRETAAIFTPLTKGASFIVRIDYNFIGIGNYMLRRWEYVDRVYAQNMEDVIAFADRVGVFPELTVLHLPSTDHVGHEFGSYSQEYVEIIENLDDLIGEISGMFEINGVRDRISMILMADHGQIEIDRGNHIDLSGILKGLGLRVLENMDERGIGKKTGIYRWIKRKIGKSRDILEEREKKIRRYNAICAINGRCAFLYLRSIGDGGWRRPKELPSWRKRPKFDDLRNYPVSEEKRIDIIERLIERKGVGFVVCRREDGVEIFSKGGHARIEKKDSEGRIGFRYEVVAGMDPLLYGEGECRRLIGGDFHGAREWLDCSADSRYPGVVAEIGSLFMSPRCGDLVIFADDGWDFEPRNKNRSAHGGFEREEMRIPFLWSGPGIDKGRIGAIRSVDIFPTICDYLGVSKERMSSITIDGVSFIHEVISH